MSDQMVVMRPVSASDVPLIDKVREAAFAPVFASFRSILGDELYELVQRRQDEQQAEYLVSILAPDSEWDVYVATLAGELVGFVSIRLDEETKVGEIGLNAVHPAHAGQGIGTAMYEYALARIY